MAIDSDSTETAGVEESTASDTFELARNNYELVRAATQKQLDASLQPDFDSLCVVEYLYHLAFAVKRRALTNAKEILRYELAASTFAIYLGVYGAKAFSAGQVDETLRLHNTWKTTESLVGFQGQLTLSLDQWRASLPWKEGNKMLPIPVWHLLLQKRSPGEPVKLYAQEWYQEHADELAVLQCP